MILIYNRKFPLFTGGLIFFCIMYLGLSFAHTDNIIATYNLARLPEYTGNAGGAYYNEYYNSDRIGYDALNSYDYLVYDLSSDAAPAIAKYRGEWVDEYFERISAGDSLDMNFRTFNLSKYRAKQLDRTALSKHE